jgi:hypothetical protein
LGSFFDAVEPSEEYKLLEVHFNSCWIKICSNRDFFGTVYHFVESEPGTRGGESCGDPEDAWADRDLDPRGVLETVPQHLAHLFLLVGE